MKKEKVFDMDHPKLKKRVDFQGDRIEHVDYILDKSNEAEIRL